MEENKIALSVALAVYNEESNLAACLDTIKDIAQEIVIVDGSSTDKTVEIGKSYGAKVMVEENRTNFHINKAHAINACQGEWILQLDADERVSSMLKGEIQTIINSDPANKPDAYYLKRHNYFLGSWMNKGGMYPDPVIRLFKKGKAHLPEESIHELMTVDGVTGWLDHDLLHYADPKFARYLVRSNRYTTLQAETWLKENKFGVDPLTAFSFFTVRPLYRFLEIYLRHKGFQDGFPGLVFAFYSGLHLTSSYVKYWEAKKTGNKLSLSQDWA
jgi:glycosyltransferase involved in cell wall biosynthesis